ncbi:MAG: DUF4339 domain-containing protein [Bacteroidaceae bacterium]|nr:DUF4339 domain-containing protein [Bacteroidaceae bacterium]
MNNDQSFFSVDRLIEFGLGMAVAQQMVGMMNQAMQGMYIPGSIQAMPAPTQPAASAVSPATSIFYVALDGKQVGPLGESELSALIAQGNVTKDTLCWQPGMACWQPVEQTPEVLRLVALAPPPLPAHPV